MAERVFILEPELTQATGLAGGPDPPRVNKTQARHRAACLDPRNLHFLRTGCRQHWGILPEWGAREVELSWGPLRVL